MSSFLYALLLRLLPRRRRQRFGAEMALVFDDLRERERETPRALFRMALLWIKEALGMTRFALRERFSSVRQVLPRVPAGGPGIANELRWAWKNLHRRRGIAAVSVVLMALAMTANVLVFAVADSLIFNAVPYPTRDRLVAIVDKGDGRSSSSMSAALLEQWRRQDNIFTGVHGYLTHQVFLTGEGTPERVSTISVTLGLLDLLGVAPKWGRLLATGDDRGTGIDVVVISEDIARARFGDPQRAVGRRLETTDLPLHVVGVMPRSFRFPSGRVGIWRALDPRGSLAENGRRHMQTLALLRPGLSMDAVTPLMRERSPAIAQAAGHATHYIAESGPIQISGVAGDRLFIVLLGGALCLLLIACASSASLELATAVRRARSTAIHRALGASRLTLVRVGLYETAMLAGGALVAAVAISDTAAGWLTAALPEQFLIGVNPVDVDQRTIVYMTLVAAASWVVSSVPVVLYSSRANLASVLTLETRGSSASQGGIRLRRLLTVGQISVAVVLLVGGVLFARTYVLMLKVDKGFNSDGLVSLSFTVPPQMLSQRSELSARLLERLATVPGVLGVTDDSSPEDHDSPFTGEAFEQDGMPTPEKTLSIAVKHVSSAYFSVVGIPVRAGRVFQPGDAPTDVVIGERFARQFWPNGAIGRTFRRHSREPWRRVVAVVGDVRMQDDGLSGASEDFLLFYSPRQPPRPSASPVPPSRPAGRAAGGPSYGFIPMLARIDEPSRLPGLVRVARATVPQFSLTARMVDDEYASWVSDTLWATRVMVGFALLAFLVAVAGIYALMAFLVATRAREVGIRMALGAGRWDVGRLVLGSSLRLVAAGVMLGLAGAWIASRWIESQLFGVTGTDPSTYAGVALLVIATALLATLHPARQAANVDPAITLRAE